MGRLPCCHNLLSIFLSNMNAFCNEFSTNMVNSPRVKDVQEVKDHIKKEEMNPTISCNSLVKTTTQTIGRKKRKMALLQL